MKVWHFIFFSSSVFLQFFCHYRIFRIEFKFKLETTVQISKTKTLIDTRLTLFLRVFQIKLFACVFYRTFAAAKKETLNITE